MEKRNDLNRIQVNKSVSLKFNPQLFDVFKVHTFRSSVKRRKWDVDDPLSVVYSLAINIQQVDFGVGLFAAIIDQRKKHGNLGHRTRV